MAYKWSMVLGSHRSGTNMLCMSMATINKNWYTKEILQPLSKSVGVADDQWRLDLALKLFGKPDFPYYMKHPEHRAYAEIPGQHPAFKMLRTLVVEDNCYRSPECVSCLTKILFQQHPCSFGTWLNIINLPINIIYLRRENLLDIIISSQLAYKTREWLVGSNAEVSNGDVKIHLDPVSVLEEFCFLSHQYTYFDRWLLDFPNVLFVEYDQMINDWDTVSNGVLEFVGRTDGEMKIRTKKQISRKQSDVVANYQKLKDYFVDTEWEKFFKD